MTAIDLAQFASDNTAGACPEALRAFTEANPGSTPGYGNDAWTQRASDLMREVFETDCEVFFTFNGTAANALVLAHLCRSYHSVIAHEAAHIETDECGAPEFFTHGSKLLLAPYDPQQNERPGQLTPSGVRSLVEKRSDIHYPKPRVVSITQPTELGTLYTLDSVRAIGETCRELGLKLHMDGARFANAVAALGVSPAEVTWKSGVDVLCFGGTKAGMPVGDAVVFFDKRVAEEFDYRCKQAGQLASKMRFLAAPWVSMLEDGAWLRHAAHANAMAERLANGLAALDGVELIRRRDANAVFVSLSDKIATRLREGGVQYYSFIGGGARLMCSWATRPGEVDALLALAAGDCR